jgi:RNA polymerase sigma-70 factor (family 1)
MIDLKNFEFIYIHHWEKLYAFCFRMTRDESLTQNIVQDIFTDLWERRKVVNILSIQNYLFRAAKNQVLKEYRKKKFDTTIIDEKLEDYLVDNIPSVDSELMDRLYLLLENLPGKRKEILIMNKIQEIGIDDIAAELNISRQTVKNQLSSALKRLRFDAGEISGFIIPAGIYLLLHLNDILTIS